MTAPQWGIAQTTEDSYQINRNTAALVGGVIGGAATLTPIGVLVGGIGGVLTERLTRDKPKTTEKKKIKKGYLASEVNNRDNTDQGIQTAGESIKVTLDHSACFSSLKKQQTPSESAGVTSRFQIIESHPTTAVKKSQSTHQLNAIRCFYLLE